MATIKCGWSGCAAESDKPFTDGWSVGDMDFGMKNEMLCPHHSEAYEALAVNAQPPTPAKN